ncbi:MAG: nucleoside hydrolase [Erysipelotrichaceae bacterium]|nr:nucleoside hydrolase [Erysipelotrichaceae bacterium]MBR3228093.1 nucleoside hydrolase [Erysipelotrichaceae bacterium]
MKKRIWLDCNLRGDDKILIDLIRESDRSQLSLITTVACENDSLSIAREIRNHVDDSIKVLAGADHPLAGKNFYAPDIKHKDMKKVIEEIYDVLKDMDRFEVILCGGATNLSYMFNVYPDIQDMIEKVVFVGGAYCFGTVTPVAEHNAYFDPEALEILLEKRVPLYFVPEELRTDGYLSSLALPALEQEELFDFRKYKTGIEINADYTRGMTVIYRNGLDHFDYIEEGDEVNAVYVSVKEEQKNSFYPELKDSNVLKTYIQKIKEGR